MNVLLIQDGVVVNCICADHIERAQEFYPGLTCIEQVGSEGIGYTYDGETFTAPEPVVHAKSPISKLVFLRRFPNAKRIAIRAAAATNPILGDGLSLLDAAENVRTDDQDTVLLVGYCVQLGFLTADEATVILE